MISSKVSIKNMVQIIRSPQHKSLVAKVSLFAFVIEIVSIVINRTLLVKHLLASLLLSEVALCSFLVFWD